MRSAAELIGIHRRLCRCHAHKYDAVTTEDYIRCTASSQAARSAELSAYRLDRPMKAIAEEKGLSQITKSRLTSSKRKRQVQTAKHQALSINRGAIGRLTRQNRRWRQRRTGHQAVVHALDSKDLRPRLVDDGNNKSHKRKPKIPLGTVA